MENTYTRVTANGYWATAIRTIIVVLILLLLTAYSSMATCCMSICSGNWESGSTWSTGSPPACGDTIIICSGHIVTVNTNNYTLYNCAPVVINVAGTLNFGNGRKLNLSCGSSVVLQSGPPTGKMTAAGGGGSSNQLNICDQTVWRAEEGNQEGPRTFNSTLPVSLISFTGKATKDGAELSWETASEINNDYFLLERSADSKTFLPVARIDGNGTTNSYVEYNFLDKCQAEAVLYYRLIQVDFDGHRNIYDVIKVDPLKRNSFVLYPNPSGGIVNLTSSSPGQLIVTIHDITGKMLATEKLENSGQIDLRQYGSNSPLVISLKDDAGRVQMKEIIVLDR